MKTFSGTIISIIFILLIFGCNGKGSSRRESKTADEKSSVPDTGYTGIKQFMSGNTLVKEVTFKNGVREGVMKSFYINGKVRQIFWYHNGFREDSARWLYEDGKVFRSTPYKHDTIDGIQKQYFTNGKLKANLGYKKGLRTTFLEEFGPDGKLISGYPELVVTTSDNYKSKGSYSITLALSNKSERVKYFRGDLTGGVFDTAHIELMNSEKGVCILDLKKTKSPGEGNVGVIAEVLTNYGNNYFIFKKIGLPYNDLN